MSDTSDAPGMDERRAQALRSVLTDYVRETPERRRQVRRRRLFLWGGTGLVVLAGAGVAGAAVVQAQRVTNATYVTCLESDERGPSGSYPGATASIADNAGPGRVDDAIGLCSEMWRQGVFAADFDPLSPTNAPAAVPSDFQVCVMRDGSAAVVPSENSLICDAIGLAPLEP